MTTGRPRLRIVVVENEGLVRLDTEQMLRSLGHEVVGSAHSAESAVREAEMKQPDVVLMDIQLEGARDGIDAAQEITNTLRIPCLFVSGCSNSETRSKALAVCASGYLIKPLTVSVLEQALAKIKDLT
jgi:DNA-binding NarL/FixJ family response regulator